MASKIDTGVSVLIGRFSPFHLGHAHVLQQALERSEFVVMLVGSSFQARSLKNPFAFGERKTMIQGWVKDWQANNRIQTDKLAILPLEDEPYNDAEWIRRVQHTVSSAIEQRILSNAILNKPGDIAITGSDRDESTWYLKTFPQWRLQVIEPLRADGALNISATDVRKWMFDTRADHRPVEHVPRCLPETTRQFINSFMVTQAYQQLKREYEHVWQYQQAWAAAPYAPTFVTVDAVVIQSGHVLAVKRRAEPGKGLWALPGGFLNQAERLRDGAIRELMEETSLVLASGKNAQAITREILRGSILDKEVFDKPDRSSRGRTITHAFLFRLDDTKPLPKVRGDDDAEAAMWMPIDQALRRTDMWMEDHHAILSWGVHTMEHR
jgi:bifunctional NMN adenylyltransferase/nudix hydrolase